MANTIDFPFSKFAPEAEARGYKPVKYSQTGYFVKSANGIRCEFQTTKGGVNSVGYGSAAPVVEALKTFINEQETLPLVKVAELKGSINFAFKDLDGFFALVTLIEGLKLPEKKSGGRPAGTAKVETPKVEKVAKPGKPAVKSKEPTKQQKAVLNATGGTAKSVEEIKAGNMARLKATNEKRQAEREAKAAEQNEKNDQIIEDMADGDIPAFLMNDIVGKGARVEGAE